MNLFSFNTDKSMFIMLMYHKIGEQKNDFIPALNTSYFEKQINFLRRQYKITSLEDILTNNDKKEKAIITFDDGYKCIYKYAYPILKKYNIPATVFLTVESIENNIPIWSDLLSFYVDVTQIKKFDFNVMDKKILFDLTTKGKKLISLKQIKEIFKRIPNDERLNLIKDLKLILGINKNYNANLDMLSWPEIKEMSENNITFGGHTMTHPILTKIPLEKVRFEINESKKIIEKNLEKPVLTFAYPNGEIEDFNEDIKNSLKSAGYRLACTTIFGKNDKNSDPYELKRVYTSGESLIKFALRLRKA